MAVQTVPQPTVLEEPETDRLRGEVERLQAELARKTGEAQQQERLALSLLLEDLRVAVEQLPFDEDYWTLRLGNLAFDLARAVGESWSIEELGASLEWIRTARCATCEPEGYED